MSIEMPTPIEVDEVAALAKSETLVSLNRAQQTLNDPLTPTVISVVKNECHRLAEFLSHHRALGIRRFAFIDNGSDDGSVDFLAEQPDVDLFHTQSHFSWKRKHGWISQVIARTGPSEWWLLLDADEHAVYDRSEIRPIRALVAHLERTKTTRARGALVDMYSDAPLNSIEDHPGKSYAQSYPYFDAATYRESRSARLTERTGGPRQRFLAEIDPTFAPALTKYPLFRLRPGELAYNPHLIWPPHDAALDPCLLALKHFKFDTNFSQKISKAVASEVYWNNSFEYKRYLQALKRNPSFTFAFYGTRKYQSSEDFVRHNIVSTFGCDERSDSLKSKITAAKMRHLASLHAG